MGGGKRGAYSTGCLFQFLADRRGPYSKGTLIRGGGGGANSRIYIMHYFILKKSKNMTFISVNCNSVVQN